jgi:hypothetical protein
VDLAGSIKEAWIAGNNAKRKAEEQTMHEIIEFNKSYRAKKRAKSEGMMVVGDDHNQQEEFDEEEFELFDPPSCVTLDEATCQLTLPGFLLRQMHDFVNIPIMENMVNELAKIPKCTTIIMTGGASQSNYLIEQQDEFVRLVEKMTGGAVRFHFIRPPNGVFAVLGGNLRWGQCSGTILYGRMSDWFGVATCENWDPVKHKGCEDQKQGTYRSGFGEVDLFTGHWTTVIEGGHAYPSNYQSTTKLIPCGDDSTYVEAQFYMHPSGGSPPPYNVKDALKLVVLTVPCDLNSYSYCYQCTITTTMAGTELALLWRFDRTGKSQSARLNWGALCSLPKKDKAKKDIATTTTASSSTSGRV